MTATGLTLESPKIGQTITFLETAEVTGGEALVIQAEMRPGAFMPPHRHLHQEETFEVLQGIGTFTVAGRKIVAASGELVRIPAGVAHPSATPQPTTFSSKRPCDQLCAPRTSSSSCSNWEPTARSTSWALQIPSRRCD